MTRFVALLAGTVAGLSAMPATGTVVTSDLNVSIATTPYTLSFGSGASVTFTLADASLLASDPVGVSTAGSAQIATVGNPFFILPQPALFFVDHGGSIGPTGDYAAFPVTNAVPNSSSHGIIGLRFDFGQGYKYGYVDIAGTTLNGFRYETTPGKSIDISAVPEPAAWMLAIVGFGVVGAVMRSRRRNSALRYCQSSATHLREAFTDGGTVS